MAEQPTPQMTRDDEPEVFASRPPTSGERALVEKFHERLAGQSKLMDELAKQMITVEMAVPGAYAAVLALLRGQEATLPAGPLLPVAFGGWLVALALTFGALFPRDYTVDASVLRADPDKEGGPLGVEDFFRKSAVYKRRLLAAAAVAFWIGVAAAVGW